MKIHKFKPTKKKDTLLFKLLIAVAALHAVALLILGGMVISEIVLQPETTFEAPPPPEKVEQKKQYQHKATQQNKSSAKLVKRIQIPQTKMNNVSTANIALPSSDIAGTSLGGGLAPKGFGDLNITMTSVNLMGLAGKTEKIVILLDTSRYMMTDARGALSTYNVIKKEIKDLIGKLPPTILFNVIAYALPDKGGVAISPFSQSGLVTASQDNKEKLYAWLDPINATLQKLEVKNSYKSTMAAPPQATPAPKVKGGYDPEKAKVYKVYHAAMEQGADTIYILTAKWTEPSAMKRPWTQTDKDEYARDVAKAKKAFEVKLAEYKKRAQSKSQANKEANQAKNASMTAEQKAAAQEKAKAASQAKNAQIAEAKADNKQAEAEARAKAKAWLSKENERRRKAGISLSVATVDEVMKQQGFTAQTTKVKKGGGLGIGPAPKFNPPPMDANKGYSAKDLINYYVDKLKASSGNSSFSTPTVNMIIFKGKDEDTRKIEEIASDFCATHNKGKIKVLTGLSKVTSGGK